MDFDTTIGRREFIKNLAISSAIIAAKAMIPGVLFANEADFKGLGDLDWNKTPCRFCGVGCGLLVAIKDGKAVAVKGDPQSPVNKGLCCVKGYHSIQSLYAKDRLKSAQIRKNGKLVNVPLKEALDLVASKMQETIKKHGKDSVSMYGSGQWTIPDGYIASKFMKGAIGTNNLEANARLCMASAVTGFISTFGLDEPMGCYEDIDYADVFVLWGNNMAEMHPVLFSRILDRKAKNRKVKIIDLATRTTRTSYASDKSMLFVPQTDLAIANAICYEILNSGKANFDFLKKHVSYKKGKTNIGYGLEDGFKFKDKLEGIDLDAVKKFLEDYTPEKVSKYCGVSVKDIRYLASLYSDPKLKVMSLWCMGVNQHTRGTWMNNLIYNIHLLVGKISTPGNSPFSLTGQPSACGTVREVGTLTHKLPYGVVMSEKAREKAAKIWQVPVSKIPSKPTHHTVSMFRALDRGDIKFMWIQVTNPMVTMPKLKRYRDGANKEDRFIVVSDIYPTPTTEIADVVLPSALWFEREGMFGNSERRTQHFNQLVQPPGQAMSDGLQIMEVAKRMGHGAMFPWTKENYIEKIWSEYSQFHANDKHSMAPYEVLKENPGMRWPYVKGKETRWRFHAKYDPAAKGDSYDFYGKPDHRAWLIIRPFEMAPEPPNKKYPFLLCTGRVIEHWHTGSMTRRIPALHQAVPEGYVEVNPIDAKELGIVNNTKLKLSSRRGSIVLKALIDGRARPQPGELFVPFFDESLLINELTLDAFCPISKQPDYKKCAVKIEKV
ncbi:MAG: periplasmic nitrate reductase subunit alpha [Halobacteriovorax sp.]|nr:periplasmic nitrate reductase subunit alpha [Halobacteriovorax sp.]|tara:strand:- start:147125 stop:149449 length:2325 start_codon:yes stop_codon:yes gene_type:complete